MATLCRSFSTSASGPSSKLSTFPGRTCSGLDISKRITIAAVDICTRINCTCVRAYRCHDSDMRQRVQVGDVVEVLRISGETPFGDFGGWIGGYRVTAMTERAIEVEQTAGHHAGHRSLISPAYVRPLPGSAPVGGAVSPSILALSNAMDAHAGKPKRRPGRPPRAR